MPIVLIVPRFLTPSSSLSVPGDESKADQYFINATRLRPQLQSIPMNQDDKKWSWMPGCAFDCAYSSCMLAYTLCMYMYVSDWMRSSPVYGVDETTSIQNNSGVRKDWKITYRTLRVEVKFDIRHWQKIVGLLENGCLMATHTGNIEATSQYSFCASDNGIRYEYIYFFDSEEWRIYIVWFMNFQWYVHVYTVSFVFYLSHLEV